jgi:hypothetical protein
MEARPSSEATQMRTKLLLILLLAASTLATAQTRPSLLRQHFQIAAQNGQTYGMTELVSQAADQSSFITLFEGDGGQRYVFTYNDNSGDSKTTIEVRNLDRNLFVRGWYLLPYSGTTVAEARAARARLKPEQFVVPFTIETNGFTSTERIDRWHNGDGAAHRSQLVQHVNGDLMRSLQSISVAYGAGSPAVSTFCRYVESILAPAQLCRRDRELSVEPTADDCTFDARFGYPCAH